MLPIISSIPAAEFEPGSPNFHQVFATMALVLPEVPEAALDAPLPPYLCLFDRALPRERLAWARRGLEGWRAHAVQTLRSGAMDSLPLLAHLTDRLRRVATGGGGVAEAARHIIEAAEARKRTSPATTVSRCGSTRPCARSSIARRRGGRSGSARPHSSMYPILGIELQWPNATAGYVG